MKKMIGILFAGMICVHAQAQTKKTVPAAAAPTPPAHKMVVPTYQAPVNYSYVASPAAHSFLNEVDLNLSGASLKTYKIRSKSYTDITLFGTYSYDLGQNVQVGADVGLTSFDSTTQWTLAGTGTYNLDPNYSNSVFFKGGLGLYPVDKGTIGNTDIKNEFGLYVAAGKRFKIWDHVNYKPMLVIAKISDLDAQISIFFLNISVNWN